MNAPKCTEYDYINFLVAAQRVFGVSEAARSHPDGEDKPAHDAYTRLLQRLPPDSEALWAEVSACIDVSEGLLVIDDTTLDKPYARQMALVTRHWSGKHGEVVQGLNLLSLVWSDGDAALPCDYRLDDKAHDGLSKNDHFREMLQQAHARGFQPALVAFDSWYSSLDNLKLVCGFGWEWLTRLKSNRQVSMQAGQQQPVSALDIPANGLTVHLRGYGLVKVFRTVAPHGNADFWATSRLDMTEAQRRLFAERAWLVEVYHRALKQFTGIERGQFRLERAQRNHIGLALRAYLMEPGFNPKAEIVVEALRIDLVNRVVYIDQEEIHLTPKEYDLLRLLATHLGKVLTHRAILNAVWGPEYGEMDHYVRVFVNQLRKKLRENPARNVRYILNEPGIGYRFIPVKGQGRSDAT